MMVLSLLWQYIPNIFCLHLIAKYFFFFLLGISSKQHIESLSRLSIIYAWICLMFFLPFSIFCRHSPYLLTCTLSIPSLYALAGLMNKSSSLCMLNVQISKNCFAIYLFQMLFLHLFHSFWSQTSLSASWHYFMFLLLSVPMTIAGTLAVSFTIKWTWLRLRLHNS